MKMRKSKSIVTMILSITTVAMILGLATVIYSSQLNAQESIGGSVEVQNSKVNSPFTVSDGSRIDIDDKGISIIPPKNWEIHRKYPNTTLLLQIPYKKGMKYQRTIQIMRFGDQVPIDDITGREFEKKIEEKYSKAEGSISDYRMRNHMVTKMEDGTSGVLYYSEFMLQESALMQAHILLSSSTHHYLLTYTDLASHFEGEQASEYLTNAWEAMVSAQLDSEAPVRLRAPAFFGFSVGFLLLIFLFVFAFRKYKAGKKYENLLDDPYDPSELSGIATREVRDFAIDEKAVLNPNEGDIDDRGKPEYEVKTREVTYIEEGGVEEEEDQWNVKGDDDKKEIATSHYEDDDDMVG